MNSISYWINEIKIHMPYIKVWVIIIRTTLKFLIFARSLWPKYWFRWKLMAIKWKRRISSIHWYLVLKNPAKGSRTVASQSWAVTLMVRIIITQTLCFKINLTTQLSAVLCSGKRRRGASCVVRGGDEFLDLMSTGLSRIKSVLRVPEDRCRNMVEDSFCWDFRQQF